MAASQLLKNSFFGTLQVILTAILTLISVPIFIHKLGMELYGIFAIVSVIGNLNLLTNFGLNGSLLVYLAQQGKCKESDHDIIVTQIIIFSFSITFTLLIIIFSDFIIKRIFTIPVQYISESKNLLIFLTIANALLLIGQTFTAIIDAKQKIYITNICQFSYSLIYWSGMIIVVLIGGSLTIIGIISLISAIFWLILVMTSANRIWGKSAFEGGIKEFKRIAKKQLTFGSKIFFSGLAGFMFEPLSKILISNFVGINAVAFFEIGAKIRSQVNGILTKALYPMYPYMANAPKSEQLHKKLFDFSKKIQLLVVPLSLIVVFAMTILLRLWLGKENLAQTSIFVITMTAVFIMLGPPVLLIYQYLSAKNMADKNIWVQMTSGLVNVTVFFALLNKLGVYTILFSNSAAYISSYLLCNYYQFKYFGVRFKQVQYYYLKLIIYGIVCITICAFLRHFLPVSLWDLIIYPVLVTTSFILFIRFQKLINSADLELYFGTIPFLKNNLTRLLISE